MSNEAMVQALCRELTKHLEGHSARWRWKATVDMVQSLAPELENWGLTEEGPVLAMAGKSCFVITAEERQGQWSVLVGRYGLEKLENISCTELRGEDWRDRSWRIEFAGDVGLTLHSDQYNGSDTVHPPERLGRAIAAAVGWSVSEDPPAEISIFS